MIVVIDYGIGNLGSVTNSLSRLGIPNQISSNPGVIKTAQAVILPGVGAARQGMKNLIDRNLDKLVVKEIDKGKPFLGLCLGMQLLFETSEEGNIPCLGIFKGTVKKFRRERKVPQIGWNNVKFVSQNQQISKLFNGISDNSYFYFVNSYYCAPNDSSIVAGTSEYGERFASVVAKNNVAGVQFHPEKSGQVGFQLLKNFIKNYVN